MSALRILIRIQAFQNSKHFNFKMLIFIKELKQCIYTKKYYLIYPPKSYPFIFNTKYCYNNTHINKAYMFPHTYCFKGSNKNKSIQL